MGIDWYCVRQKPNRGRGSWGLPYRLNLKGYKRRKRMEEGKGENWTSRVVWEGVW